MIFVIIMEAVSRLQSDLEKSKTNADPQYSSTPLDWTWETHGGLGLGWTAEDKDSEKLALFDMDGTIIKTKSGKSNPVNGQDWVFWNPCVPKKIQEVKAKGFRVIIVTNQKGISLGFTTLNEIQSKIHTFSKQIGVEMSAFIATKDDDYRKPLPGIWNYIIQKLNKTKVDKSACFFVGDAAGRPKVGHRHKDHSDADRLFAINCGLTFYTPEHFFLDIKEDLPELPRSIVQQHKSKSLFKGKSYEFDASKKDSKLFVISSGLHDRRSWQREEHLLQRTSDRLSQDQPCRSKSNYRTL